MEYFGMNSDLFKKLAEAGSNENAAEIVKKEYFSVLKDQMLTLLLNTIESSYLLVKEHPLTDAYVMRRGESKEPETIGEYQRNLVKVRDAAERVKRNIKSYGPDAKILGENISDFADMRDKFSTYVSNLIFFANGAMHLIETAKNKSDSVYLREILKTLPAMEDSLKRAGTGVSGWERFGDGFDTFFAKVLIHRKESVFHPNACSIAQLHPTNPHL